MAESGFGPVEPDWASSRRESCRQAVAREQRGLSEEVLPLVEEADLAARRLDEPVEELGLVAHERRRGLELRPQQKAERQERLGILELEGLGGFVPALERRGEHFLGGLAAGLRSQRQPGKTNDAARQVVSSVESAVEIRRDLFGLAGEKLVEAGVGRRAAAELPELKRTSVLAGR